MHPHHEHRAHKVEKRRVHHITKGYASGGAVHHDDAPDDNRSIKRANAKRDAMAVSGRPAKQRSDRPCRARGGRTKHKGTNVNVIVAPHGGAPAAAPAAPPMPVAASAPPVARPPVPPMPPPGMPGAMPPGMPPGAMPPRHAGGRTYAQGGRIKRADGGAAEDTFKSGTTIGNYASGDEYQAGDTAYYLKKYGPDVSKWPYQNPSNRKMKARGGSVNVPKYAQGGGIKDGPAWKEGMRQGTPVQHTNNKNDGKNVGRGRVVTFRSGGRVVSFRTGGAVEAPKTGVLTPKLPGGAGGGEARMVKMRRAEKNYKRA